MEDWTTIVQNLGPLVWRTAYRLLNHEADTADCFQRTFLAAVEFARTERVRHWPGLLVRLTTARALDQLRQSQRLAGRTAALTEDVPAVHHATDPLRAAAERELAERLRDALAGIDSQQAQVFCMACLDGMGNKEIAAAVGMTANHVGVLLHRARTALRERLRAFQPGAESEHVTGE